MQTVWTLQVCGLYSFFRLLSMLPRLSVCTNEKDSYLKVMRGAQQNKKDVQLNVKNTSKYWLFDYICVCVFVYVVGECSCVDLRTIFFGQI